jgi:NAD(P)-dependent dehydrogenase (short-subunit alcohol dehydrogenase family)
LKDLAWSAAGQSGPRWRADNHNTTLGADMPSTLFDLTGKTALITGGNSGIGLGFAEGVAQHGADVCIWGTNAGKNAAALQTLAQYGVKTHAIICDVSDEAAVERSFSETLSILGRVDACFANAGVVGGAPFVDLTTERWQQVLSVNLNGLFFTLRCAARHMKERAERGDPGGRLVGTASLGALVGMPRNEAYACSKGGVISMMQALAVELARYGVTANSVLPGHIETPMTSESYATDKYRNALVPRIPLRRFGTRADFSGIAVYLMSNASAYHTGDSILIDGAYSLF